MRTRVAIAAIAAGVAALAAAPPSHATIVERVVAVVGDKPVLLSELRDRARPFLVQVLQRFPPGPAQAAAQSQMLKELLGRMIDEELEAQAAEKSHTKVSSDEIDKAFQSIAGMQHMTVAELFADAKARSGLSEQEYREEIRRQILEGKMLQLRVKGHVRITDEDVKNEFERAVREERKHLEYHPAWILLRVMPDSSPAAVEERRDLAEQIAKRARAGEDFTQLASQYSDDTTSKIGGDLGVRAPIGTQAAVAGKKPVLAPDLEDKVMPLEAGMVTAPIQLENGDIVVIKLLSRQPSHYTTLEAAEPEMVGRLQTEILEKAKRKWLDELKARTHLDVRL